MTATDSTGLDTSIQFVQFHLPPLTDGDYTISVSQEVTIGGEPVQTFSSPATSFSVRGDRFRLGPGTVRAVFPPDGSLGDHSNVLPHVVLSRSTLPWERLPLRQGDSHDQSETRASWLALLLFGEDEKPAVYSLTVGELETRSLQAGRSPELQGAQSPYLPAESGENASDLVNVIAVKKSMLGWLMPPWKALELMAHVRVGLDASGDRDEFAVVIGDRLPVPGGLSTVHLVSLEGWYTPDGSDYAFDSGDAAADDTPILLVSLKSWSFACATEDQSFRGLLCSLDGDPILLSLPQSENSGANTYLAQGYVLLPHRLRMDGQTAGGATAPLSGKTLSWYRGPLVTGEVDDTPALPARAADELVRYDPGTGLFDVTYAAAWELGRLLALQSKTLSTNLYLWKRTHAQTLRQAEDRLLYPHLPIPPQPLDPSPLFASICSWFDDLSLLKGVPFNYLVPDERMLPAESIRFFRLDPVWIDCLLDGAFSIGRVTSHDAALDAAHLANGTGPTANGNPVITGVLLRSAVISDFPDLQVEANPGPNPLQQLRIDRLSPNVLICLFEGEVTRLSVHRRRETLHFGLDTRDNWTGPWDDVGRFYKQLRDQNGEEKGGVTIHPIPWRDDKAGEPSRRLIDIVSMTQAMSQQPGFSPLTSAQFALGMIEGVDEVVFGPNGT